MIKRIALTVTILAALAAAVPAFAGITVYSNAFKSRSDYHAITKQAGKKKKCKRNWRKKSALGVTVKGGKQVCQLKTPVEGDSPQPDLIVQVETKARRIIRWELSGGKAGPVTEVASKMDGQPLGGMNDLVVRKSDGSIYVSQQTWFMRDPAERSKVKFIGVIRIAPDGKVTGASGGMKAPNGLCFSPDEKTLYVTEYSEGRIYSCEVKADGSLGDRKVFADLGAMAKERGVEGRGGADGIRCDEKGNLYSTGPGGIWVVSSAGKFVAMLPGRATNLCFGGPDGKTLFITTGSEVLKIGTKNKGL